MHIVRFNIVLVAFLRACHLFAPAETDNLTYAKQEMMIPMRDGTKLYTTVFTPSQAPEKLPFLILRTPYGIDKYGSPISIPYISDMAREGYIFVFQDLRGRYKSEGRFQLQDLYIEKKNAATTDESTDAYDTIEWLLRNISGNNGKAGIYGVSAVGATTLLATIDPNRPVPYRQRPIESTYGPGSRWSTWLLEDQRFVHNRPDVLSWESETLTQDLTVTGNLLADLFASTTGTDADWVVKLIDVYPEAYPEKPVMGGYQLMVANDVFRGRFRHDFSRPEPVKPDEVNEYRIDLHAINHVFKKGHKIMVQVQSTWFPIIDRNPQKYVPNIFEAEESDFITAYHRIYRSAKYPSHVVLPVVEK